MSRVCVNQLAISVLLRRSRVISVLLSLLLTGVAIAQSQQKDETEFRDGMVLVGFVNGTSELQAEAVIGLVGARHLRTIGVNTYVLQVRPGSVMATVKTLKAQPEVRYAEPDYIGRPDGVPNDPSFNLQWGFQNTGQTSGGKKGAAGADEKVVSAWDITHGSNSIAVAVVDTGIDYTHPDLAANVWSNPGGINGCAAGTHGYNVLTSQCDPMDADTAYNGHGTHVAGIIGAVTNNATGVAGVNWITSLVGVKWIDSNTGDGVTSDLIAALDWVVQAVQAGVNIRVVNDSITFPGDAFSQALSDEIDKLGANDILFVTPSGNTAQNNDSVPRYPCVYARANEICVAATNNTDHLWSSSNWGVNTVNLAAPGFSIYSTLRNNSYGYISGTSMSAAQVSGAAALILSTGYQSATTLKATILNNVDVLSALSKYVNTSGRLNVCKAIPGCGVPTDTAPPVISGTAQQGSTLTTSNGTWTASPTSYTYQWSHCDTTGANCSAISGAIKQTYILSTADVGFTMRAAVTARNAIGSNTATSAQTAVVQAPKLTITTQTLPAGTQGAAYSAALAASGGSMPYSWSLINGTALPAGLQLNTSTGVITGTPTTAGTTAFTVQVTDSSQPAAQTANKQFSITVNPVNSVLRVQAASIEGSSVSSVAATFPTSNTAGNLIVAFVRASTTTQTITLSDSAGNTYSKAVGTGQTTDGHQVAIFYAPNIKAGANTVTASFSGTNNHPFLAIYEYSGVSRTSPLDKTAGAQGTNASVSSGATATTTAANELVFAGMGLPSSSTVTWVAGSGFTLEQQDTRTSGSRAATEDQEVTATGAYAGTFSLSGASNWSAVVATFISGP